jgi:hypothetical protein
MRAKSVLVTAIIALGVVFVFEKSKGKIPGAAAKSV